MAVSDAKAVITLKTTETSSCRFFCGQKNATGDFATSINHYLTAHGCELLHVGGDTSHDYDGKPWQGTIAVLGSPVGLPEFPKGSVRFIDPTPLRSAE
jgi:hypothetical protein